jgi:uncharacterized SAM-binding protein YcdF (DUF218 family)
LRRISLALLVILAALIGAGLWLFYFVGTDPPYPADAIVVLSGNPGRPATGIELQKEGVAPELVLSVIPPLQKKIAKLCSSGRAVICFHAKPESTVGEARTFAQLARRRGWHSAVIVSSRFHLRRARLLFARCTDAKLQVASARTTWSDYGRNIPLEIGKFLDQLTLNRAC